MWIILWLCFTTAVRNFHSILKDDWRTICMWWKWGYPNGICLWWSFKIRFHRSPHQHLTRASKIDLLEMLVTKTTSNEVRKASHAVVIRHAYNKASYVMHFSIERSIWNHPRRPSANDSRQYRSCGNNVHSSCGNDSSQSLAGSWSSNGRRFLHGLWWNIVRYANWMHDCEKVGSHQTVPPRLTRSFPERKYEERRRGEKKVDSRLKEQVSVCELHFLSHYIKFPVLFILFKKQTMILQNHHWFT